MTRLQTVDNYPVPQRRSSARDTLLTAEVLAKNPGMMGQTFAAMFVGELGAMSVADRRTALDSYRKVVDSYAAALSSGTMGPGHSGSFTSSPQADERPEKEWDGPEANPNPGETMQQHHDALHGFKRAPARDARLLGHIWTAAEMDARFKAFYAKG